MLGTAAMEYPWLWIAAPVFLSLLIMLKARHVSSALFLLCMTATALTSIAIRQAEPDATYLDGRQRLWRGTVERVRTSDRSQQCVISVDSPAVMRCRMTLGDISPQLLPGDIVHVEAAPESRQKYADIPALAFPADPSELTVADMPVMNRHCRVTGRDSSIIYAIRRLSASLSQHIYDSPLAPSTSRLLAAAVLGGGDVGTDRRAAFRAAGLSHLLCVSGFHVAVFAMAVTVLLFPLKASERGARLRYAIIIAAVWLYALVTGLQPSVFRAAVMLTAYYMARLSQRNSPPLNSLCVAIVIILLANPLNLFSIGFQLSISAVLGLLVFAGKINPVRRGKRGHDIAALFAVPLAATVATAPVLLWHFHSLPLLSVPANAIAALLFPLFMTGGCAVVLLSETGLHVSLPAKAVDALASATDSICAFAADKEWAMPDGIYLSPLTLTAICVLLILSAFILYSSTKTGRLICSSFAVAVLLIAVYIPEKAEASDIVAHGNTYASEIRIRHEGRGYVIPLSYSYRPKSNADAYFADGRVHADSIVFGPDSVRSGRFAINDRLISAGGYRILIADADTVCAADVVVLKSRFKAHLDSVAAHTGASTLVIAADMKAERREEYAAQADSLGMRVCDLAMTVFYTQF